MKRLILALLLCSCGSGASESLPAEMQADLVVPIVRVDEYQVPYIQAEFNGTSKTCVADSGAAGAWIFDRGPNRNMRVCVSGFCREAEVWTYVDLPDECLIGLDFFGGSQYEFDLEAMVLRVGL